MAMAPGGDEDDLEALLEPGGGSFGGHQHQHPPQHRSHHRLHDNNDIDDNDGYDDDYDGYGDDDGQHDRYGQYDQCDHDPRLRRRLARTAESRNAEADRRLVQQRLAGLQGLPISSPHTKLSPLPRSADAGVRGASQQQSAGLLADRGLGRRDRDRDGRSDGRVLPNDKGLAKDATDHDSLAWKPPPGSKAAQADSGDSGGSAGASWLGSLLGFWLWRDVRMFPGYYFTCLIVAASQGFSESFAALAVSYRFKDDLGQSPSQVQAASSLMVLAWMVKPLFGFISDSFPVFGYRRKPYLFVMGILGSLCWFAMASFVHSFAASVAVLFLFQLSMAFINTLAKALIVEQSNAYSQRVARRHEREARRQAPGYDPLQDADPGDEEDEEALPVDARAYTSFQISMFAGTLHAVSVVSGYVGGALLEWGVDKRTVMGCSGILPLLCAVAGLFLAEEAWPAERRVSLGAQVGRLWGALKSAPPRPTPENMNQLPVWYPAVFILLWMATPTSGAAMFYFFSNDLQFGPEIIARIQLLGSLCGLGGILVYQNFFATVRYRRLLLVTCFVGVLASLLPVIVVTHYNRRLGIPDVTFCIADTALISAVGEIALMPLLTLAATVSEAQGVEGSLYACLMSLANIGSSLSELLGAVVMRLLGIGATSFENLWLLLVICSLSSLLPLPLLWVLVPEQAESEREFFARQAAAGLLNQDDPGYQAGDPDEDYKDNQERRLLLPRAGSMHSGVAGHHGDEEGDGDEGFDGDEAKGLSDALFGGGAMRPAADSVDSSIAWFPFERAAAPPSVASEFSSGPEELPDGPQVMLGRPGDDDDDTDEETRDSYYEDQSLLP